MELRYSNNLEGISWERIAEIFTAVGWGQRDPADLRRCFERSSFVRFAIDGDRIVGFGRTMDDGRYYGMIVDLVIDPAYQRKGIGSHILRELREAMGSFIFTTLTAASGQDDFYYKQGWKRQRSAFIWPRSDRQSQEHAGG
jgi:GNAT superfamily N-acetyltransferase